MPHFKVTYRRRVVEIDEFEEIIEADSLEAAQQQADASADEFDSCCPDDVTTLSAECQSWQVDDIVETVA